MKRYIFLLILAFAGSKAFCQDTVYLLTIPKSGTGCIEKYFSLIRYLDKEVAFRIARSHLSEKRLNLPEDYFLNSDVKKIILVRDLRDVFMSALSWIEVQQHWLCDFVQLEPDWKNQSFEEKILQLVNYQSEPKHIVWKYKDRYLPQQIKKTIDRARVLSKQPNVLVVKFEDLSGGYGKEVQIETMRKINSFLNVNVNEEEYDFLSDNLFGNKLIRSFTFREGGINKWCSMMDETLQEKIWDLYGDAILDLGYEKEVIPQTQ